MSDSNITSAPAFAKWLKARIRELEDLPASEDEEYGVHWLSSTPGYTFGQDNEGAGAYLLRAADIAMRIGCYEVFADRPPSRSKNRDAIWQLKRLLAWCKRRKAKPKSDQPTPATHPFLTPPQIARMLKVKPDKVRAWIRKGRLKATNMATNNGGRARYRVEWADFHAFIRERQIQPPVSRRRRRRPSKVPEYF
jgi:excisionase family DNA binding protein